MAHHVHLIPHLSVYPRHAVIDIRDFYTIEHNRILGTGISGSVKTCVNKLSGVKFALKTLNKRLLKKDKLDALRQEIRIMAQLDHPNILRLHEYFETADSIYLILELCTGGELLDVLQRQNDHHYTEHVACRLVHTMLSAVRYCHEHNIVHRDLKLENFLFINEEPEAELKLIDFGLSQHFAPLEVLHSPVGTAYYVAPEVLEKNYDAKCDVWSIGVIAYMLLSGTPPFNGNDDAHTLRIVKTGMFTFHPQLFDPVSEDAKDFISKCLTKNVSARLTAEAAQRHSWFSILHREDAPVSLRIVDRLHSFRNRSALSRLCMEVVAHTLSAPQISELRKEFAKLDVEESGEISYEQMQAVLSQHRSFTDEDIAQIFSGVNMDHTGRIHYHEFIAATITRNEIKEENVKVAFEKLSNHHEYITAQDIRDLLGADCLDEELEKVMEDISAMPEERINYEQVGDLADACVMSCVCVWL